MRKTDDLNHRSPDLIDMMPLDAKRVIDVGCGEGKIAQEYHIRAKPEYYMGIEILPEDVAIAKQFCDECLLGNIEEFSDLEWRALSNFDLWVFGDVLEHLYDPWKILCKVHSVIPAGGQLMCCIPNAQHWSIQARLSIGEWRYENKGLLDKTHIRFFTKKTIIELLESSGFEVLEITPRYVYHPTTEKFLDIIGNLATACGGNPEEAKEDASVFQYIFKARKN